MTGLVPLLVADIGDVIGILVFIVIALLSVAGQIMNKAKEDRPKAGPAARPRPRPQPQPGQQQGQLANEIDQFVRQATQRRAEGGRQPVAQGQGGRPQPAARRPVAAQPPVAAVPVEAVPAELLQPVSERVPTRGASRNIGTLSSRGMESEVSEADENLEERVHEVFDHKLGQLSGTMSQSAEESPVAIPPTAKAAAGVAAMLADPANIRQAIVLTEILQRPEHRWS